MRRSSLKDAARLGKLGFTMKKTLLLTWVLSFGLIACSSSKKKEFNDVVDTSMGAKNEAVQGCFKSALAQGKPGEPANQGEIEVSVNVAPQGTVTSVSVIRSTMNSKKLEDCVQEVVRRASFSKAPDGRVKQFTHTYKFGSDLSSS